MLEYHYFFILWLLHFMGTPKVGQVQTIFSDDTSNEDFRGRFGREKPSKDAQIIFMCKVGIRSDKAAQTVTELGFRK